MQSLLCSWQNKYCTENCLLQIMKRNKLKNKILWTVTFVKASVLSFYLPDLCWSSFKKTNTLYGMIFGIIRIAIMLFWTVGNIPFWAKFTCTVTTAMTRWVVQHYSHFENKTCHNLISEKTHNFLSANNWTTQHPLQSATVEYICFVEPTVEQPFLSRKLRGKQIL